MRLHIDPQHANQRAGIMHAGRVRYTAVPRKYARILGALLVVGALGLALPGCSGGDSGGSTGTTVKDKTPSVGDDTGGTASTGTSAAPTGGGGTPMGPGAMMGSGGSMGGMMGGMGGMGGGTQQAAVSSPVPKVVTPPPHRPDPFRPWFSTETPPPPVLTYMEPVRIAIPNSAAEEKPEGVEIQEVPNRRVAGILTGNGVYALLDNFSGTPEVVKPGQVLDDGYRVASINASSVTLKKVIANRTYTQVVPLTDAGSTSSRFSAPAPGGIGGPGMMMPGMPGMGGIPGGRRRGKGGAFGGAGGIE